MPNQLDQIVRSNQLIPPKSVPAVTAQTEEQAKRDLVKKVVGEKLALKAQEEQQFKQAQAAD